MNRLASFPQAMSRARTGHGINESLPDNWLLWQLADSAFPTGSFAHSGALEACWQIGHLRSARDLGAFIETALTQLAHGMLPLVLTAHDDPSRVVQLNALNDAFLTNHVSNRASRLQGQALIAAVERVFGDMPQVCERIAMARRSEIGHYAPVFGCLCRALGLDRATAGQLFMFVSVRGWISAAVRLGIVGPIEGQRVQVSMASRIDDLLCRGMDLSVDDIAQTAPLIDICHGMHDRLYSRLFQT